MEILGKFLEQSLEEIVRENQLLNLDTIKQFHDLIEKKALELQNKDSELKKELCYILRFAVSARTAKEDL